MANEQTLIDVTKSLVPVNQEMIAESITYSARGRSQPIPYAGKNVLPTPLGYQSFFGTEVLLGSELLSSLHVQDIISYRLLPGNTILLALCAEGCYFSTLSNTGTPTITNLGGSPETLQVDLADNKDAKWTFLFNSPQGSTSPWHLWTHAILGNDLYLYQKGMKFIARIKAGRYGRFTVEKLLPSYIVSNVAKIYKYQAYLEVKSNSAYASRNVTSAGVPITVVTDTPEKAAKAHGELVSLMNSAGMGAILSNYEAIKTNYAFMVDDLGTLVARDTGAEIKYIIRNIGFGFPTVITAWTTGLVMYIRGTPLTIPTIPLTNMHELLTYIADYINSSGIPNILAYPFSSDKSSLSQGTLHLYVEHTVDGSDFVISNPSCFNPPVISNFYPTGPKFKRDNSKYNVLSTLDVYPAGSGPYPVGTVFSYSDANISISYTTVASETASQIQDLLYAEFEKAGYLVDWIYYWIYLPDNMSFDFNSGTYPSATTSDNLNIYLRPTIMGSNVERTPSADKINITSTGELIKRKHLATFISHPPVNSNTSLGYIPYSITLPATGGALKARPRSAQDHIDSTGDEFASGEELYEHTVNPWTTLAEANAEIAAFVSFMESVPGFGGYPVSGPTPTNPTASLSYIFWGTAGAERWAGGSLLLELDDVEIGAEGAFSFTGSVGSTESYSVTFTFKNSDAVAFGTAMGITMFGVTQTWDWVISGSNLALILSKIALLPNYTGTAGTSEVGGVVTINATFTVNSGNLINLTVQNGGFSSGAMTATAGSTTDTTDTLIYTPLFEEQMLSMPLGQDPYTITITTANGTQSFDILPGDSVTDIDTKIVSALESVTLGKYRFSRLSYDETKYIGNIDFSVLSLDGSDPLVSVGASNSSELFTLTSISNDNIELAQVEGICTARNRLMAWDYTNTIYLGSATDPTDFTPSITTQANAFKVEASKGNITLMLPAKDGVVIYSTDNVAKGTYQSGSQQLYSFRALTDQGVIDPRHITMGRDAHFFLNSDGVYRLDLAGLEASPITRELADFLRTYKYPTKIQVLADRYLIINLLEHPITISGQAIRDGATSDYEKGLASQGLARPVALVADIPDVPLGQNLFPTFKHCLVLDLLLEKWGYGTLDNLAIFSLSPINQGGYSPEKDYALSEAAYFNDSRSLAAVLTDGQVVLLNDNPSDAYILYGKHRLSNSMLTKAYEVEAQFVDYPEAYLQLEPSDEEGRLVNFDQVKTSPTFTKASYRWPLIAVARWFNILVRGRFNLSFLSIDGGPDGKRR